MSVILRLGDVNTDTPYSRLISDGSEYEPTVDASPCEPYRSPTQTYPGCFGLPYQDHNYGAPPPPTPPQTPPPPPQVKETFEIKEEVVVTSDVPSPPSNKPSATPPPPPAPIPASVPVNIEEDDDDAEDPTRCICDFVHDDGYMIQCDKCSVWQHIVCMGLDRDSIPETYFCEECHPRSVDRVRAREFQIRKREFLKSLLVTSHDSSATDTDPEEVSNRLRAYGLDTSAAAKQKQKIKVKKKKDKSVSKMQKKVIKSPEVKTEKENENKEAHKKNRLILKDFTTKTAQAKKEKLTRKIEKMRAERISKEMRDDKFSSDDLKEDENIINTIKTITSPVIQDENAQTAWSITTFNEWEQSYEVARYNQYTTYVQEYLNSAYINGHNNDIADLVTDGLRVQRCSIKELKNNKKGLESTCNIPDGQPVIEVIGKVMTRQQYDKDNFGQRQLSPFVFFYGTKVLELDLVIDASDYGNDARFIRRSCQPNAEVRQLVAGGQAHFIAVATKEILEDTEITIPYDYDYKKWNFCIECACLRNNCPVSRYQKRRLRFQKLQIGDSHGKKLQHEKIPKMIIKSPVKSPTKSPIVSPEKHAPAVEVRTPCVEPPGLEECSPTATVASPQKMIRRSQVSRQVSYNASTQVSSSRGRTSRSSSQLDEDSKGTETIVVSDPLPPPSRPAKAERVMSSETSQDSLPSSDNVETQKPTENRKLTREERKLEAIVKAIEKMEKRNYRKVSVDVKPKDDKEQKKDVKKEKEKESQIQSEVTPVQVKIEPKTESPPPVAAPPPPPEVTMDTTDPDKIKVEESAVEPPLDVDRVDVKEEPAKPVLRERERLPPKGKKAKKAASRRRTRNASGASAVGQTTEVPTTPQITIPPLDAAEPASNSSGAGSTVAPPVPQISASCPATPCADESQSAFMYHKTKRHLMNEWLSEKDSRPGQKSEMLEVGIEENMFVTCLPSPRNSMDRLRRNSQSCATVTRDQRHPSFGESSVGSAKKRWLRQAMGEGSSDSGMSSPVPGSGAMSPNPQAMSSCSPGGSPPVDFVTPLKKRRLARESLCRESVSSESPSQTPTPSSVTTPNTYFANLNEAFETKMEEIRNSNGFGTFFSPLKASDESEEEGNVEKPRGLLGVSASENIAGSSVAGDILETSPRIDSDGVTSVNREVTDIISCAEMDCSSHSCDTGTEATLAVSRGDGVQISNSPDVKSSSETADNVTSEQKAACDNNRTSANLEPDSTGSVCAVLDLPREAECDNTSESAAAAVDMETSTAEVDSTEVDVEGDPEQDNPNMEVMGSNNECASSDEDRSDLRADVRTAEQEDVERDKQCTSSSSEVTEAGSSCCVDVCDSSRSLQERLAVVGSSTDQLSDLTTTSTSRLVPDSPMNDVQEAIPHVPTLRAHAVDLMSLRESEVGNSTETSTSLRSNDLLNSSGHSSSLNFLHEPSVSSLSMSTGPPTVNRHLKFLNDSNFTSDMTVDSTIHFSSSSSNLNSSFVNCSDTSSLVSYDSDSVDVTSASDLINGGLDDPRRLEDPCAGFSEMTGDPNFAQKEKKKVSLQEYLKRKKDKTSVVACSPVISSSGKQQTASMSQSTAPLKLTTPISMDNLEKLPPLPSLPSLPMFEKTERKEFKSSSDLLSPIFNRREKTEEIRKPMSLSERLRHEFGLDDSTDTDTDTENKEAADPGMRGIEAGTDQGDVPPPPPPPPPQTTGIRTSQLKLGQVPNGNPVPPLMSIKTFPSQLIKPSEASIKLSPGASVPLSGLGKPLAGGAGITTSKLKLPTTGLPPMNNLLASGKSSVHLLKSDLTAQLAALKAKLSQVQQQQHQQQQSVPTPSSLGSSLPSTDQPINGISGVKQVFDYGHQSSNHFMRQNSAPGGSKHLTNFNKTSPSVSNYSKTSPGYNKVSPRYSKVSPTADSQPYRNSTNPSYTNSHTPSAGSARVYNNVHRSNVSPPAWKQNHSHKSTSSLSSSSSSSSSRKHYTKQSNSHNYS